LKYEKSAASAALQKSNITVALKETDDKRKRSRNINPP
jgi:hypothetical protein